jgi:phosphate transport system permease protein
MKDINRLPIDLKTSAMARQLSRRHFADFRFRLYGILSICLAVSFIVLLISTLVYKGWPAFFRTDITLPITLQETPADHSQEAYDHLLTTFLLEELPGLETDEATLLPLLSAQSYQQLFALLNNPQKSRQTARFKASAAADAWLKNKRLHNSMATSTSLTDKQIQILNTLNENGRLGFSFDTTFFTGGDSQEPEIAGIYSALIGSLMTLAVALVVALPIGLGAAIYLSEFAPRNKFFDLLEVNINNLAAIPTIIFGLLGLALFLNIMKIPRSASLAGGLTLGLIILPIIIIASKTALKTVPMSIRYAALALGASRVQTLFHHVLPLGLPGILTGVLLGLVRALGESAPLLMLGMVAFIVDPPRSLLDPATVLPVQIYSWAKNPAPGFVENTSAATLVLLLFLLALNSIIVLMRRKFEKKW